MVLSQLWHMDRIYDGMVVRDFEGSADLGSPATQSKMPACTTFLVGRSGVARPAGKGLKPHMMSANFSLQCNQQRL